MEYNFATKFHEKAFNSSVGFLKQETDIFALVLTGSAARGEGSFDSDIDLYAFIENNNIEEAITNKFKEFKKTLGTSDEVSGYFDIELHFAPYEFMPLKRGWTSGPDEFELDIGNLFVYSKLIFERDNYFSNLKAKYLPYYDENLRQQRLQEVLKYCKNNLGHIEPYVRRGLYFQAFKRLYDASREFMQALFISNKIYPIAYDKWIKKQFVEILKNPELYKEFVTLYEIQHLESNELVEKAKKLEKLLNKYIQ